MKKYMNVLTNFKNFSGRTGKGAFWYFTLINVAISIVLSIIGGMLSFTLLASLFSLIILIPSIAVGVRRMHDVGKDWWFYLIPFYNLYLALQSGDQGANEFGEVPVSE